MVLQRLKLLVPVLGLVVLLFGELSAQPNESEHSGSGTDVSKLIALPPELRDYPRWPWRYGPLSVSKKLYLLCTIPIPGPFFLHPIQIRQWRYFPFSGNNHEYGVDVYANEPAARRLANQSADPFPVGSVIIKQKVTWDSHTLIRGHLGVMTKHAEGFNPHSDDWEFQYITAEGSNKDLDALANCYECHRTSSGTAAIDYVFAAAGYRRGPLGIEPTHLGANRGTRLTIEQVRGTEEPLIPGTRVSLLFRPTGEDTIADDILAPGALVRTDYRGYPVSSRGESVPVDFFLEVSPKELERIDKLRGKGAFYLQFSESQQSTEWVNRMQETRKIWEDARQRRLREAPKKMEPKVTINGVTYRFVQGKLVESK